MHPFLTRGRPDVLAHRGASAEVPPGNTIAAFERALDDGVDHLELDVQVSSDGTLVVFHDDRLDEVTTGSGTVGEHTAAELSRLRYVVDGRPTPHGPVTLDEVFTHFPEAFLNIDVKNDDTVPAAIDLLRRHGARDRVCVAAFDWHRIRRLRRELGAGWCTALSRPEIALARLAAWFRVPGLLAKGTRGDVAQVPRRFKSVTVVDRRFVRTCHAADVAVHVWTVNDPDAMDQLVDVGIDAVITDRPATARNTVPG